LAAERQPRLIAASVKGEEGFGVQQKLVVMEKSIAPLQEKNIDYSAEDPLAASSY
jgi:hypothetical protein